MIPSLPKLFITGYISKCYYNYNLICRLLFFLKKFISEGIFLISFLKTHSLFVFSTDDHT